MLVQRADNSTDTSVGLQQVDGLVTSSPSLYVLRSVRTAFPSHHLYPHLRLRLPGFHTKSYREGSSRFPDLLRKPASSQQQHLPNRTISLAPQQHHTIYCGLVEGRYHVYRLLDTTFGFIPTSPISPNASYVDVMLLCQMMDIVSFLPLLCESFMFVHMLRAISR